MSSKSNSIASQQSIHSSSEVSSSSMNSLPGTSGEEEIATFSRGRRVSSVCSYLHLQIAHSNDLLTPVFSSTFLSLLL